MPAAACARTRWRAIESSVDPVNVCSGAVLDATVAAADAVAVGVVAVTAVQVGARASGCGSGPRGYRRGL